MNLKKLQALLRRRFNIPRERSIRRTILSFSLAERTVFYALTSIFVIAGLSLVLQASNAFMTRVPIQGGSLTEGMVGNPRFINPVLALSEADKNLTNLIFSGLIRITAQGKIENDLAGSVEISDNQLVYTVSISEEAYFHDGTSVTADDVIFTIQKITDPLIKSPRRGNWDGVSIEKVDEKTVRFTLKKAYSPFIYNLTTGILPRHIWKNVTSDEFSFSQFNTLPVGSGPYQVERVERNEGGIPDYYKLTPFDDVSGNRPYIASLIFKFYPSEPALVKAYNGGDVGSVGGISPDQVAELDLNGDQVIHAPLTRIFAVFFNQSQSKLLSDKSVRQALNLATPKEQIIVNVLGGFGTAIDGPLPAELYQAPKANSATTSREENIAQAKKNLADAGWKPNADGILEKKSGKDTISMSFSISTGDAPELRLVAEELVKAWQEIGAKVEVHVYETGELNQSVIRPRHFDALLFGEVVGREADLFPFWHSSQRNDPGLNIAMYANSRVDKLLEETRTATDGEDMEALYKALSDELRKDQPAIFLYSPSYLYTVPEKVQNISLGSLSAPQDRFLGIRDWYIETDKVWNIFLD